MSLSPTLVCKLLKVRICLGLLYNTSGGKDACGEAERDEKRKFSEALEAILPAQIQEAS